MGRGLPERVRRILSQPASVVLRRVGKELRIEWGRWRDPRRGTDFGEQSLLAATETASLEDLWGLLGRTPYPVRLLGEAVPNDGDVLREERAAILERAEAAMRRTVDLLGSGPVLLGPSVDWHRDYKSGERWDLSYAPRMDYVDLRRRREVKFPWELSRLQWALPLGQAYHLTRDERYAESARDLLESWIRGNPYALGVNWASTMEVALRIISWSFLFQSCKESRAWSGREFRLDFLRTLYLHGEFTERYPEESDVNGNHFTANAAGLVFAGLFFARGRAPDRWARRGWTSLTRELPLQVGPDGVDIEASAAYHRLVLELFLFPALYRLRRGLDVPSDYRATLIRMAGFAVTATRSDGSVPLWGDADDGRVLPLGTQAINDHRYLAALTASAFDAPELLDGFTGALGEAEWVGGGSFSKVLRQRSGPARPPGSAFFPDSGVAILRNASDHVFIDAGPVGFRGRGGHGHNDCLSFEAVLEGVPLVTDCGSFVYTASPEERNRFRSTAFHNTPRVDGEEINRFEESGNLWRLRNDAQPEVIAWHPGPVDLFCGSHSGYRRLSDKVVPCRSIVLDHASHRLAICDSIHGAKHHDLDTPLHLAPGVAVLADAPGRLVLSSGDARFELIWIGPRWELGVDQGRRSPRYGMAEAIPVLRWKYSGVLPAVLAVAFAPLGSGSGDLRSWLEERAEEHQVRLKGRVRL